VTEGAEEREKGRVLRKAGAETRERTINNTSEKNTGQEQESENER
jgi:hypothetical protein